jgi:hypothetical protein
MKRRGSNHLAWAALLLMLAGGSMAAARHRGPVLIAASSCTADTDCKGERVCHNGKCVDPQAVQPAAPPAPKASVPTPGPGAAAVSKEQLMVCSDDGDCGAGQVCRRGDCLAAPPPAAAKARPAAPASTPAAPAAQAVAPAAPAAVTPAVLHPGACVSDVDCAGDSVCARGACVFPAAAAAAPAASATGRFKTPNILSSRRAAR